MGPHPFHLCEAPSEMNIFYLTQDPGTCAKWMVDSHVVKMILESCQLLSTCHPSGKYLKHTHVNHPCAVWVRESTLHYLWLATHAIELCHEYTRRYKRTHSLYDMCRQLKEDVPVLPSKTWTPPPQCMPDEYKVKGDTAQAYRNYYANGKTHLHKWKRPEHRPPWIKGWYE